MWVRRARPGDLRAELGRDGVPVIDRARPLEAPPEAGERRYLVGARGLLRLGAERAAPRRLGLDARARVAARLRRDA